MHDRTGQQNGRLRHPMAAFILLVHAIATLGCFGPREDKPEPDPPTIPEPADESEAKAEPTMESLEANDVIRSWGRDPVVAWDTVVTLAHLSKLAYEDGSARQEPLEAMGFSEVRHLKRGSHIGFVATNEKVAVVAFRGTNQTEILDWLTNVDIRLLEDVDNGCHLHTGFQSAYEGFAATIEKVINRHKPERVWITGHSLGGAMAACCAYDRERKGKPVTAVVTFGQPRIGNKKLAEFLDAELGDRYLRLMNEGDPVPILPPCFGVKLPAYWHSGRRAWFLWGQLYTTQGPQVAAQADTEDTGLSDSSPTFGGPVGNDAFRSMTENDFLELQRQLKAMQAAEAVPLAAAPPENQAPLRAQSFGGLLAQFIMDRIGEHNMDEYLKQLYVQYEKELTRKSQSEAPQ